MALTVDVKNAEGKKVGSVELPAEIFDAQTNIPLIHQVVTAQLDPDQIEYADLAVYGQDNN